MRISKDKAFLLLNTAIPLLAGGGFYYVFSPEVDFVKKLDLLLGTGFHMEIEGFSSVFRLIRYYGPDMFWTYALVFALYIVLENKSATVAAVIAVCFFAGLELLQLTSFAAGTFDPVDIAVSAAAAGAAVLVIKRYLRRK